MTATGLDAALAKMRSAGVEETAVRTFAHYYALLADGATGTIPEASIEPLDQVPELTGLAYDEDTQAAALGKVAIVKLNGGLGTGMGLTGPKSALQVREGVTFLDVIARQVLGLRERFGVALPLILMNSFRTREESLAILANYPDLAVDGLPLDFLQNAEPKLTQADLSPVDWPSNPDLEWCPPGHGDVYLALQSSGVLATLRDKGIRYIFLSNSDNLGATCDPMIAAWLLDNEVPYAAEVCVRTASDRKGGHLARRLADGRIILRDSAQVADGEDRYFQDNERHTTFHSNNLWIDVEALAALLAARDGVLGLPIIVNRKTVDPSDKASVAVIQVETAMGTAIELFEGAQALLVPRTRFRPVKTTNDLLVLRSDWFEVDERAHVVARGEGDEPLVTLDGHYTLVPDFDARFPTGAPSLLDCRALTVTGDVTFGAGVVCQGEVRVVAVRPAAVPDGEVLRGEVHLDDEPDPSREG